MNLNDHKNAIQITLVGLIYLASLVFVLQGVSLSGKAIDKMNELFAEQQQYLTENTKPSLNYITNYIIRTRDPNPPSYKLLAPTLTPQYTSSKAPDNELLEQVQQYLLQSHRS
ncbi:unnamed protein product [marine sediment metagenome]|uniref:Uncharacterized protein n=1 Tax=marine sediment metagenome TaxID=412755 RepID=X1DC00_9ZZZZ